MLKKKNRLPSRGFRAQKTFQTNDLILKISENQKTGNRFGFVVSKRIDKRASARNKIKRVLRACMEEKLGRINAGLDLLLIVKRQLGSGACQDLEKLLKKEKYLK